MHPILSDAKQLGLYLLGCLPIGIVLIIGLGRQGAWATAAVFFLPLMLIYAFIGLSAFYLCRAFPIGKDERMWRAVPAHVCAAATVGGLCVALAWGWARLLESLNIGLQPQLYLAQPWLLFAVGALLFWLATAFHYVLIASSASQLTERRLLEAGLLAREAELKALRAQLDPHFLFNSLNSISSLTARDPPAARKMCLLLADFLRDTLRLGAAQRISLQEELNIVERYLSIEQVRLGARLNVLKETSEQALGAKVPALILQPLAENAVLHGIAHLLEGGTVTIRAYAEHSMLVVWVTNPCDPDRPRHKRAGIGLSLVRQRLQSQFGLAGQLEIGEERGEFTAKVSLPFDPPDGVGANAYA
ncbi:MAG TPA: histidine kinase [Steroidobacteraceae bacterium]|jgi:two-component system sensor histidine kinase AlgZ|nr:histidine kinase [Steroidobacteraceae bacterium]